MPVFVLSRPRQMSRLDWLCQMQLAAMIADTCSRLDQGGSSRALVSPADPKGKLEARLVSVARSLPGQILESLIPQVLSTMVHTLRQTKCSRGLLRALDTLPQPSVRRLDLGALSEVRLYPEVNGQCRRLLRGSLQRLPCLVHLNLESKCNDDILVELAKHCPRIEELVIHKSEVSDRGLMALGGIAAAPDALAPGNGCFQLKQVGLHNCFEVTTSGVGSLLRNLPQLLVIHYAQTLDAVENVARIDGAYLRGDRVFHVQHLEQTSDFYEFDSHPEIMAILLRVCPRLDSLRFCLSDEGCKSLSLIGGVRHLQLEMEDVANGFRLLTRQYSSLVSLQLTFRNMAFSQLIDLADNCPQLAVLRLRGSEITDSHNLVAHNNVFARLRILELHMTRHFPYVDMDEPEPMDFEAVDTITPQLMHFLLDCSRGIEELHVQAVANFMADRFIASIFERNPLRSLRKLDLVITPGTQLTAAVARGLLASLPAMEVLGLSRWNVTAHETKEIAIEARKRGVEAIHNPAL